MTNNKDFHTVIGKISIIILFCFFSNQIQSQTFVEKHLDYGTGSAVIDSEDHNLIVTANLSGGIFRVMKIDSSGAQIWSANFGSTVGMYPNNVSSDIIKATGNKYLIVGTYDPGIGGYNKVNAILIDSAGNSIWDNNYSTSNSGGTSAVYDSVNSVYYILGAAFNTDEDIYLAKINTSGVVLWEKYFDYGGDEFASKIVIRNDSDIWIVGSTNAYSSQYFFDGLIINVDSDGNENYHKHYGGNHHDHFNNIFLMDNGALIIGSTISYGAGNADAWILRTNESGNTIWTKTFGYATGDSPRDATYDGTSENLWVVGSSYTGSPTQSQGWVFKMDTSGTILYSNLLGGIQNDYLSATCYSKNSNTLYAIGDTYNGRDTVYFVRLDSANLINDIHSPEVEASIRAFPNPSSKEVYLNIPETISGCIPQIDLMDVLGNYFHPEYVFSLDGLVIQLPTDKGIYILTLTAKGHTYYCKLIKI